MNKEKHIEEIFNELAIGGSQIDYFKKLKEESLALTKRDIGLDEALASIAKDIRSN